MGKRRTLSGAFDVLPDIKVLLHPKTRIGMVIAIMS
jgi:hypothetical protein